MTIRLHLRKDVFNRSVGANDEGRPDDPHYFLPIHVLFLQDVKRDGHFLVGVGQQRERKVELLLELFLRFWRVRGNPKQHGAGFLNLFIYVAEPASLDSSAGGVGARIKVQHNRLATQRFQRDLFFVLVLQSKVGSLIMDIHGNLCRKRI
jgi:hypothetical protein